MNLLDLLKDQVTGPLAKQASGMLGESENGISKALGGGFPAILGSMISKGSSTEGAGTLLKSLTNFDGGLMDNIGGMFGGNDTAAADQLMGRGGGVLDMLLGDKLGGVIDLISKVGGLKKDSTGSLLRLATPFLMSIIGKKIAGKGVGGLMDLLKGQKDHVAAAMPAGMGSLLGLGNIFKGVSNDLSESTAKASKAAAGAVGSVGSAVRGTTSSTVEDPNGGGGMLKWVLPLILVAGLAYVLLGTDACKANTTMDDVEVETEGMMGDMKESVKDGAEKVGNAMQKLFANVNEGAKKALDGISFSANSAGANMKAYIDGGAEGGDGVFRFNDLKFATGSAQIEEGTGQEVDNLAAILKAYPGVNVEVQGHTDNTGDAAKNKALSQARADAVQARLNAQGIDAIRTSAVGYGSDNPVTSNDTAEGQSENRRVEVKISN